MANSWGDAPVTAAPAASDWGDTPVDNEFGDAPVTEAPSPYSPEGLAASRQALVQSTAEVRRRREEADASDLLPKWRVGVRAPFSSGDPLISFSVPEEIVAFGSEAVKSSPSVAAGTAAASASMPIAARAGLLPGPIGTASRFGIPLVAGGLAAIGTRLGQDAVLPEILPEGAAELYEKTTEAAARNPTSAMLGQFAGTAPFFRPGLPVGTTGNARLAVPAITGAIGGGIEGAQQIASGDFDAQRLATATLGSALLNRETGLGRRIGPNLVMPNVETGLVPAELNAMRLEPSLPAPTDIVPEELAMLGAARGDAIAEQSAVSAAAENAEAQRRIREVGERLMGKSPQDQLQIVDQEMRLQKDILTPAEERAGLEMKQLLKQQIDQQKALEKAALDEQKVLAETQKAAEIAAQPPEIPKSAQILAESSEPPALANVATEIGTQTSPFALQGKLNELTAAPPPPVTPPLQESTVGAGSAPDIGASVEAPVPAIPSVADVSALDAASFRTWAGAQPSGFTSTAYDIGIAAIGNKKAISALKKARTAAEKEVEAVRQRMRAGDVAAIDDASSLTSKVQFFSEAIGAAENTGSAATAPEVIAAHGGTKDAPKIQIASEIPLRDTPETGGGVRQQDAINQETAGARQEAPQADVGTPARTADEAVAPSREQRLNDAGINLPPISSMSRQAKRAELDAAGITEYNGKPLDEANPAQISAAVGKLRRGELERGSIPASVIAPLGGAGVGGVIGGQMTEREEGESAEAFQARRIRNIILGASLGGGAGAGVNAMGVAARQKTTKPRSSKGADVALPEIEAGEGIRRTAEKVILNKSYPDQLRTILANDPEIVYNTISQNRIRDLTMAATDAELVGLLSSPDPNIRIGALIEQGNRAAVTPGMEAEGARIMSDVAKNFTSPAQMLGMAKLVRSPEAMVRAVEESLREFGAGAGKTKSMTPAVREKLNKLAADNIRAEQGLARAERVARKDFNDVTVADYKAAQKAVGETKLALDKYTKDIIPESYGQIISKIIKGNLLGPLSFAKNMFGNAAWQTTLRGSESIATALDAVYSRTTGRERKMMLGSPLPTADEMAAFAGGVRVAAKEMLTGPSAESYVKYDVQRGFHPLRAMVQVFSGVPAAERLMERKGIASLPVSEGGKVSTSDRIKKLMEATLGISPEASFRFLSLGDKPVRSASEMRLLSEAARLRGLTGAEREKFIMLPDPATQDLLAKEGAEAIMAQENRLAKKAGTILDTWMVDLADSLGLKGIPALEEFNKIMGTLTVPFRPFPANFASVAINFAVPPVAFARSWVQARRGNRRESLRAMAEGVMGLMFYSAADYLWQNGLISEPADKRDKKRRSAQYETMGAQRINLSGLERLRNGEDPTYRRGDDTRDWSSMGIPAATFYVYTSRKAKDIAKAARTGDEAPTRPEVEALLDVSGAAGFAFDQSFLSGTSAFIDALQDWDNYGDRFVQNTFKAITSIPAPSTLEAVAKTEYKFIPEMKGDSLRETLKNVWDYKTMQLNQDERANYKRDLWGKPITRTPEGQNPYIAQFIDVTKAETKAPDAMKQSLLEVYQQTGSTDVYPPLVTNRVSQNGVTVTLKADDYDKLQEEVGRFREDFARRITSDPRFADPSLIPEQRIMALQRAYTLGARMGQQALFSQPGFYEQYPELTGAAAPEGQESSVLSRDVKARARQRLQRDQANVP
jgi:hypothetical protein